MFLGLSNYGYNVIPESIERSGNCVCYMAVWRNSRNTILAIKGTSTNNIGDLENDLKMVLGGSASSAIVQGTLKRARELIVKYGVNMITGHSLGGYMTEIIATNGGLPGIAFCAPGTNGPKVKLGGSVVRGFHNVNFEHDPAGNVMCGVYQHVQWSIYVECGSPTHSITYMVNYFSSRKGITNVDIESRCKSYPTGYYYPN